MRFYVIIVKQEFFSSKCTEVNHMRFTLKQLLSFIIQAKRTGKGKIGNGRMLVMMLSVIADCETDFITTERTILHYFSESANKNDAYHIIDRKINSFLKTGQSYPYERLHFCKFEKALNNQNAFIGYLNQMNHICSLIIEPNKRDSLVYSILRAIRQDSSMRSILYGNRFIPKSELNGSLANPVRIFVPALILGLCYQLHNVPPEYSAIQELTYPPHLRAFDLVNEPQMIHSHAELSQLLDLHNHENIADFIKSHAGYFNQDSLPEQLYPIEMKYDSEVISEISKTGNVYLYGNAVTGKTTYLRQYAQSNHDRINLFLPMQDYKAEIYSAFHFEHSCWILLHLLLKYRYQNAYQTYEICAAHENEAELLKTLSELDNIFSEEPPDNQPQYCLILDGINEVHVHAYSDAEIEINRILVQWKNVRFLVSGRSENALHSIDCRIEMLGIPDSYIMENAEQYADSNRISCLKSPMILNICKTINMHNVRNRAELMDIYFEHLISECKSPQFQNAIRFLIKCILPYTAFEMAYNWHSAIERADFSEVIRKAISFYFDDDRIYQNFTALQNIRMENSLTESDFIILTIQHQSMLILNPYCPYLLRFSHQIYRDYFAAKHIENVITALDYAYGLKCPARLYEYLKHMNLTDEWFSDSESEIYKLLGELVGDDENLPCPDFHYHHTKLDCLLDWSRELNTFLLTENVIRTMAITRNHVLCGVDFSELNMPMWIPAYIKFSDHGSNPCRFDSCKFHMIGLYDGTVLYSYSDDNSSILLHWVEDEYTITIDLKTKQMLAEQTNDDAFEGYPVSRLNIQLFKELLGNLPHFQNCLLPEEILERT